MSHSTILYYVQNFLILYKFSDHPLTPILFFFIENNFEGVASSHLTFDPVQLNTSRHILYNRGNEKKLGRQFSKCQRLHESLHDLRGILMFGEDQLLHSCSALPNQTEDIKLHSADSNAETPAVSKKRRRKTNLWLHRPKQRNPRPASPYEGLVRDGMSVNGFSTEDDSRQGHDQICCLIDNGDRCNNNAGNASYSKRIQKTVQQRKLKLARDDRVSHIYICDYHKNVIQSVRSKRKRKDSEDENGSIDGSEDLPEIDFFQMPVNTLRRYKRHFKLLTRPGMNKAQLADHVARHFKSIPVIEKEALTYFIYMAKNYKSRFDQKHLEHANS